MSADAWQGQQLLEQQEYESKQMNIYERLNKARDKFHQLNLKKTGRNEFAKYNYFELADFLIPALTVLREFELTPVVSFDNDYASLRLTNAAKPDEFIVITSPLSSATLKGAHAIQNLGAVETYQRRYLWVALMEIVEHDGIDNGNNDVDMRQILKSITNAIDQKTLAGHVNAALEMLDVEHHKAIRDAGNKRREELKQEKESA